MTIANNKFGDYIIFADESGDHGLKNIRSTVPYICSCFLHSREKRLYILHLTSA